MKKVILALLLILPAFVFAEVSWKDQSKWHYSEKTAMSQARTIAGNNARKACREMNGKTKYGTLRYENGDCSTRSKSPQWRCSVIASVECYSRD